MPIDIYAGGIDTSLAASGVARLGRCAGAVTIGRKGITKLPLHERIPAVEELAHQLVYAVCDQSSPSAPGEWLPVRSRPALVLLEAPDTSQGYGGLVERVYLTCRTTEILMALGVPVGWVPSPVLKGYVLGQGGGKVDGVPAKKAVRQWATELWPENTIADDNQADATVLAAMALDVLGHDRRVLDQHAQNWLFRGSIEWPPMVTEGVA